MPLDPLRRGPAILAGACLALAAACAPPECGPAGPTCDRNPDAPGPYAVGVTTLELSVTRTGVVRKLVTEVWYPAVPARGATHDRYYSADLVTAEAAAIVVSPVPEEGMEQEAFRDVPLAKGTPFPLVVFSHGNGGVRFQSYTLTSYLASHGYVVAAPDHPGDTLSDLILQGGLDPSAMVRSASERPGDVRDVATLLFRGAGPFTEGTLRDGRYGLFGHSFGASTSFIVASPGGLGYDARVAAIAPIAPETDTLTALGDGPPLVQVPTLLVGAQRDRTLDYAQNCRGGYDSANRPRYLVGVKNAGHFSFTEICPLNLAASADAAGIRGAAKVLSDGCGADFLPSRQVAQVTSRFVTAFFNGYLREAPSALAYLVPGPTTPQDVADAVDQDADP